MTTKHSCKLGKVHDFFVFYFCSLTTTENDIGKKLKVDGFKGACTCVSFGSVKTKLPALTYLFRILEHVKVSEFKYTGHL